MRSAPAQARGVRLLPPKTINPVYIYTPSPPSRTGRRTLRHPPFRARMRCCW
ncbi:hypothetical protein T492DRAFT_934515 [Pavlovales sp. CCMP2436]|nr:hypothetical protein T492DRAFT_934515 [Pavlovales sp. CCMP2436]